MVLLLQRTTGLEIFKNGNLQKMSQPSARTASRNPPIRARGQSARRTQASEAAPAGRLRVTCEAEPLQASRTGDLLLGGSAAGGVHSRTARVLRNAAVLEMLSNLSRVT